MPVTIFSSGNIIINGGVTINTPVSTTPYVQFATFNSTAATPSFQITFSRTPTAGNLLILIANAGVTFTTPLGWSKDNTNVQNTETSVYSKTSNGTETTITINLTSGSATGNLVGIEWPTWTALDIATVDTGTPISGTTLAFTPTAVIAAASEVAIAVAGGDLAFPASTLAPTISWASGFTELSLGGAVVGSGPPYDIMMAVAYKVTTVAASVSTLWTFTEPTSTVGLWNQLITTYK